MAEFGEPRLRDWGGGLLWGGLLLGFALLFVSFFADDVHEARTSAPTLSPASLATLEVYETREPRVLLVDVEGFAIDCESATFADGRLLAPGLVPDRPDLLILVAFEHGSECRDAVAEQHGPFRAKVKAVPEELATELGIRNVPGLHYALVEPHEVGYWQIGLILGFGVIGGFGVHLAFATRKHLFAKLHDDRVIGHESSTDDRRAPDPYRPGKSGRLITEPLVPAPALLARLRRVRTISIGFGFCVVAAALAWAGSSGTAIYEREQIWSAGVLAEDAIAEGKVRRTMLIGVSTDLDVTFIDQSGRLHREEVSAMSLIVGVDDSVPPKVRYMQEDPERFAVSWIHEQLWGSLALLVLGVGGLFALGVAAVVSGRRDRRPEQAAAVFEDPREALLKRIASERQVVNGSETGALTHHFRIRDSERGWSHFVALNQPGPLFLDQAESLALALYHPRDPDYLLVLSEDLHELDRPSFSAAQLRGRHQAAASESSESS